MLGLLICDVSAEPRRAGVGVTTACLKNMTKTQRFSTAFSAECVHHKSHLNTGEAVQSGEATQRSDWLNLLKMFQSLRSHGI